MTDKTRRCILVVDPSSKISIFLKKDFEKSDLTMKAASVHENLSEIMDQCGPILILWNVGSIKTDEFVIFQNLKKVDKIKKIPVIFFSDTSDEKLKVQAFDAGGVDFLVAPLEINELLMKIHMHSEFARLQSENERQATELSTRSEKIRKMEIRQQALKEKLVALTQHIPVGILLTTPDGRILDANPAFFSLVGYSSLEELPENRIQNFYYDKEDRKKVLAKIAAGNAENLEVRFQTKDRTIIWVSISSVLRESREDGIYYLSSIQDITERKKIEDEKANLLIQMTQTEKMASIGQLAAGVAHEINNPVGFVLSNLNSLDSYLSDLKALIEMNGRLVRKIEGPEISSSALELKDEILNFSKDIDLSFLLKDIEDLMADCKEGLDRIEKIVLNLKDFAHPGQKDPELLNVNIGLASTLNVITNELKYKAKVFTDYSDVPLIMGIPQQINQVFLNILINAAQSIETMGEITIKTHQTSKDVVIEISDTGCGIPKENLTRIFDPFFTTKAVGKGTGLGMNIAYNIIEQHKGSIEVESQIKKGSKFTVKLPVCESRE